MNKFLGMMMSVSLVLGLALAGCSSSKKTDVSDDEKGKDGKTEINFWYALEGDNGKKLEGLVDDFNKQSDSVHVKAVFQGDYESMRKKIRTVGATDKAPAVFQGGDTKFLSESGYIEPIQKVMDQDDNFDKSKLNEAILNDFSINGKLYAMPFNISTEVLFYNKDMFKKAGLNPDKPPKTYSEIKEYAKKLTDKDKGIYGFSMPTASTFISLLFAAQGQEMYNNKNGRDKDPTENYLNSDAGQKVFNWIQEMNKEGVYKNYGQTWSSTQKAFSAGKLAMYLDTTAVTGIWLNTLDFDFGTGFIPVPDGQDWVGVQKGGASLWISNKVSKKQQKAGWEFIKYLVSPKVQAKWAAQTGYLPVTPDSAEMNPLKKVYDKNPQFREGTEELKKSKAVPATSSSFVKNPEQISDAILQVWETILKGKNVKTELDHATEKINQIIKH